jgi:hypothetical protein
MNPNLAALLAVVVPEAKVARLVQLMNLPAAMDTFTSGGARIERDVPGSFYEFISRDTILDHTTGRAVLDLGFDAGNATGIFKMTAAA